MKNPSLGIALLLCFLILAFAACGPDHRTAEGIVEEFINQHYVYIDIKRAKQYCVGLALHKINEEIRLTSGQVIDATTRKPKIYYRLLEKRVGKRRASFLYEGTIQAEDAPEFTRRWLITVRKEGEQWRVSNFTEY